MYVCVDVCVYVCMYIKQVMILFVLVQSFPF